MNCVARTPNYQFRSGVPDVEQRISDPITVKMLSQNESQSPGCSVSGLFLACVCARTHMPRVYVSVTAVTDVPPRLFTGRGFQRSQQLKPNVITVFVKGLDKRLRGGYGSARVCV